MKEIIVYADWQELPTAMKMGMLRADQVRGEEVFSFEYDEQWLQSGFAQVLDPDLRLFTGPHHGFLLTHRGWLLSPAYDINPNEQGVGLSLNIDENSNALDLELAKSVAEYFRVNLKAAETFIRSTKKIVNNWRNKADRLGISKAEQEMMKLAFE